jgi:hypothetical protein
MFRPKPSQENADVCGRKMKNRKKKQKRIEKKVLK